MASSQARVVRRRDLPAMRKKKSASAATATTHQSHLVRSFWLV